MHPLACTPLTRSIHRQLVLSLSIATVLAAQSASAASGNWLPDASGSWSDVANWSSNPTIPGTAADDVIDFSFVDITADRTVTLDGAQTAGILKFGDAGATPDNNWFLSTGTGGPLTLQVATGAPTISVLNQTATISAALAGTQCLQNTGAGTLALSGANTYTG